MAARDGLRLRGAVVMLEHAIRHIDTHPWEPDWYVPLMDNGRPRDMQDAYDILWRAAWHVQRELEKC